MQHKKLIGLGLFFFFLSFILISCGKEERFSSEKGLVIAVDITKPKKVSIWDLFERLEIISLETTEHSLIKQVDKVFEMDGQLCVYDYSYMGRILLFDANGKFLRTIGKKGEGPDEFPDIADVAVRQEDQTVWILSALKNKLFIYDTWGELQQVIPLNSEKILNQLTLLNNDTIAFYSASKQMHHLKFYSLKENRIFHEAFEEPNTDTFCSDEFQIDKALCRGMTNTVYALEKGYMEPLYTWDFGKLNNDLSGIEYPDFNNYEEVLRFSKEVYSSRITNYVMPYHGMNDQYIYAQLWRKDTFYNLFYNRKTGKPFLFEKTTEGATMYPIYWTDKYAIGLALPSLEAVLPKALITKEIQDQLDQLDEESNPILLKYTFKN